MIQISSALSSRSAENLRSHQEWREFLQGFTRPSICRYLASLHRFGFENGGGRSLLDPTVSPNATVIKLKYGACSMWHQRDLGKMTTLLIQCPAALMKLHERKIFGLENIPRLCDLHLTHFYRKQLTISAFNPTGYRHGTTKVKYHFFKKAKIQRKFPNVTSWQRAFLLKHERVLTICMLLINFNLVLQIN